MANDERPLGQPKNEPLNRYSQLPPPPKQWESILSPESHRSSINELSTPHYLSHIHNLAREVIQSDDYHDKETGYISNTAWKRLVDGGLLAASLSDRDPNTRQEEIMQTLRILSYYDLHLGLAYGITTALAIMPIERFAKTDEQKNHYINKIRSGERMGLAITELNRSGSSAFDMDSHYRVNDNGTVTVEFEKQFQGLTGNAGLIVAARKADEPNQNPDFKIGLFLVDQEHIETTPTKMAGLFGVSYGVNAGRITLDKEKQMMAEFSQRSVIDFVDMLTKSRMIFVAGMSLGHQERMEYEANTYAAQRIIDGKPQAEKPFAQYILAKIRARRIATDAVFNQVIHHTQDGQSLLNANTRRMIPEASMVKTLAAEYGLISAENRAELMGGKAFYAESGLQDVIDIWPYKIFEGTAWMLNIQIGNKTSLEFQENETEGELFNRFNSYQYLQDESKDWIEKINKLSKTETPLDEIRNQFKGQIAARCFALGAIKKDTMSPHDFELVSTILNLEIQQLAQELTTAKLSEN